MIRKILLIAFIILLLFPVYFMLIGGIQDINGLFKMPPDLFPKNPTLGNYKVMFDNMNVKWVLNSFIITISVVMMSVIISTTAGYAFACFKIRKKELLWILILSAMMIPRITLYIPLYVILGKMKISGTLAGVIIPTILSPTGVYLSRIYFATVPKSLMESARLDGANEVQILKKIVIPISKPIVTALALFAAIGSLSDYVWQMLVLQKTDNQTMIVGFMKMVNNIGTAAIMRINPIGRSLATGTLLLLPVVLIFMVASKYFTTALQGMKE